MLVAEKSIALQDAVQHMGFNSVEDFALDKAKENLSSEMAVCLSNIKKIEEKYGMDYADFCLHFHELNFPLFDKEEDSADWNAEMKQLSILQKRLASLY